MKKKLSFVHYSDMLKAQAENFVSGTVMLLD